MLHLNRHFILLKNSISKYTRSEAARYRLQKHYLVFANQQQNLPGLYDI